MRLDSRKMPRCSRGANPFPDARPATFCYVGIEVNGQLKLENDALKTLDMFTQGTWCRRRRNKLSRLRTDAEARACDGVCAWTVRPHKDGELLIEREGISKLGGAKDLGSWMRAKEGGAAAREKAGRLW